MPARAAAMGLEAVLTRGGRLPAEPDLKCEVEISVKPQISRVMSYQSEVRQSSKLPLRPYAFPKTGLARATLASISRTLHRRKKPPSGSSTGCEIAAGSPSGVVNLSTVSF